MMSFSGPEEAGSKIIREIGSSRLTSRAEHTVSAKALYAGAMIRSEATKTLSAPFHRAESSMGGKWPEAFGTSMTTT